MVKIVEKAITILSSAGIALFTIAAIGLLIIIFRDEGISGVWSTVTVDVFGVMSKFMVIMVIFFAITGSINHLHRRYPDKFREMISGKYGTIAMVGIAMVMPGMAGGQQLQEAWNTPGLDRTRILLCLAAMMGASITMFLFRSKFIGPTLTLIWAVMATGLLLQVWALGRAWAWFR